MRMLRQALTAIAGARGGSLGMLQTLLTQGATLGVNVVTGVLTARLLGPLGRGEFAAAALWFMLPSTLATVGVQSGIVYELRRRPGGATSVGVSAIALSTGVYLVAAAASVLALPILMRGYEPRIRALADLAIVAALMNVWMATARQALLGSRSMHLFNLSSYGSSFAYLVLLGAVIVTGRLTPATAFAAQVAATAIILTPTLRWMMRGWRRPFRKPFARLRSLTSYSARAATIDLVTVFYYHVDRLVLIGLITPAEFGLYAVASSFARLVGALQAAVGSVTLADLAHKPAGEIERYVDATFRWLLWVLGGACLLGWLLGGVLLRLIYGDAFGPALPIFRILLVEASATCLNQVLVDTYLAAGRPRYPSLVQLAFCGALLAAELLLAPSYGGEGAAAGLLAATSLKTAFLLYGLPRIEVRRPRILLRGADLRAAQRMVRQLAPSDPGRGAG